MADIRDLDERGRLRVYRLKQAGTDDGWYAAFVIDGRDYPTGEAVLADSRKARRALRHRGIPAEVELSPISPTEPRMDLPTWEDWRERVLGPDAEDPDK